MKWPIFVLVFVCIQSNALAQECDCTIAPFKPDPPCFDKCCVAIITRASAQDLKEFLGLPAGLAERIKKISEEGERLKTLESLKNQLSEREYETLRRSLQSLSQTKLNSFLSQR